ncbi:flagellin [Leptospira congkakensis]|uniref:Flagellin n=1 Tax=Leptospira congkakensis TaxID=2484932 RepID=A0A4Z1AN83_9LEPT|nr:flagellin [Leptospira congkakensis]TGL90994.1 flagellin [Leptospira congkakensis]TGL92005.1 flagellin [Leptospira congkakensis]TGL99051.1 flagellin [Leptospira congkakensis]
MIINHNISALVAKRALTNTSRDMDKSMEHLATGMRINRAGDDSLGFAVSEKLRSQIRGLGQAERNTQDGMSFIQVTEGSLDQVNSILQRLRELSVQSSNGIYSNEDRKLVQLEVSQLVEEVERIGTSAEFNKIKPLDGRFSRASKNPMTLQVGANGSEKIELYINTMTSSSLKLKTAGNKLTLSTPNKASDSLQVLDEAITKVNQLRSDLGAYYNRLDLTLKSLSNNYVNIVSSESQVRDADMATEMVEYSKNQILTKSGVAMLAQANLRPESVVKLLTDRY